MKAVICGAGIAGLAAAWWLEQAGWQVLMVERAPAIREEGYMIDFFASGYDAAEHMGLLPRLTDLEYRFPAVSYVDEHGNQVSSIDYDLFRRVQQGRLLTLMRGDLERTLYNSLGGRVEVRFDSSIADVSSTQHQVSVTLTDGTEERADLLIGADGVHSRVRRLVFGPEHQFLRYLGYHTAAYVFSDPQLSARLDERFRLRAVPSRQAGCYPLRDGRVAAFYAHREPDRALPIDPQRVVQDEYAGLGWVIPEVLAHCPPPPALYYDQVAQIEMPTWHQDRVVLVGDACHAVSLLAGQGAAMAMGSAYTLADELAGSSSTPAAGVPAALARYERRVKPVIERKQAAGRRTAEWFVPGSRSRLLVRELVLRLAGAPGMSRLLRSVLTTPGGSIVPRATASGTGPTAS